MINCLTSQLSLLKQSGGIIEDVYDKLHAELVKRFGQIQLITQIAVSTLLDPRFKNLHFNDANACSKAMLVLRMLMQTESSSRKFEEEKSIDKYI